MKCQIVNDTGGYTVYTPYHAGLVTDLKAAVPASERRFDPARKAWVVGYGYGQVVTALIAKHLGQHVRLPSVQPQVTTFQRIMGVRYVGQCKQRPGGEVSAFGWLDGAWSVVFPELVLREWFEGFTPTAQAQSSGQATLYSVLGAKGSDDAEALRAAYRRMARQWHPDVCREPDAHERFIRIQDAYTLLSNPGKRARYDAGLALQATLAPQPVEVVNNMNAYRSPLRCGLILADVREAVGRLVVEKIILWEDLVIGDKTLVTSWPMGATEPVEEWV